jgi:hypothetical protein
LKKKKKHNPKQTSSARYWKISQREKSAEKKLKRKDCGKKKEESKQFSSIGLYETGIMMEGREDN